jgi:hypothetical protein
LHFVFFSNNFEPEAKNAVLTAVLTLRKVNKTYGDQHEGVFRRSACALVRALAFLILISKMIISATLSYVGVKKLVEGKVGWTYRKKRLGQFGG